MPCRALYSTLILFIVFQLVSASVARSQEPAPQNAPPIRVTVDRVNVSVIVTDAQGQFVEGLPREKFHVFDDGAEQPITGFAAVDAPAQVLLLIEAGPAVYLLEGGHLNAALALLNGLSADDSVAVVKYAQTPEPLIDFTTDKQSVAASFSELRFNLGFGDLNLSSSLSTILNWLKTSQSKKVIVLLSTGVDTSSSAQIDAAIRQLKTSDALLFAVSLAGSLRTPQPVSKKKPPSQKSEETAQQIAQADQLLKTLAESTGGRAYFPVNPNDFSAVYAQIAQLVRHEYSIAFAPPANDGVIHSIDVRVTSPQLPPGVAVPAYHIDHRQDYVAPSTP